MIDSERADRLFDKMQNSTHENFTSKDLETLSVVMTSAPVIKAFGRAFFMCEVTQKTMAALDMKDPGSVIEFCKGQGRIEGVRQLVGGLLQLITKDEEEEEEREESNDII